MFKHLAPLSAFAGRLPARRSTFSLLLLAGALSACGGGGGGDAGSGNVPPPVSGAYAVDAMLALTLPAAALDTRDPAAVATAGALMREVVDEAEDAVDDVGEWLAEASRACRRSGSLSVSDATASDGSRTRQLAWASCVDDDELIDGQVLLTCAATDCQADGRLQVGQGDRAYVVQPLDDADDNDGATVLWRGEVRYAGWNARLDSGSMQIDLRQDRVDPSGPVGVVTLEDFAYQVAVPVANSSSRRYDGRMRASTFDLVRGGCSAPGEVTWSTTALLQGDDDGDRIDAGQLLASSAAPATLAWSVGGTVDATSAANTVARYTAGSFDALCDL